MAVRYDHCLKALYTESHTFAIELSYIIVFSARGILHNSSLDDQFRISAIFGFLLRPNFLLGAQVHEAFVYLFLAILNEDEPFHNMGMAIRTLDQH